MPRLRSSSPPMLPPGAWEESPRAPPGFCQIGLMASRTLISPASEQQGRAKHQHTSGGSGRVGGPP
eukprot:15484195-Alexandrium_andersonii.AAC.1